MRFKILALLGALALATPMAAEAAPAGALTAHGYGDLAATTAMATDASVLPGDATAKIEKVWWRGGYGFRGRGFGWRGGFGYRRFGYGFGYRRFGFYRPYYGFYGRRRFY